MIILVPYIYAYARRYPWRPLSIQVMLMHGFWFMAWWTWVGQQAGIDPERWWAS